MKSDNLMHQKPDVKEMNAKSKIIFALIAVVLIIFIFASYKTTDLENRAVVLGLGLDFKEDEFLLTAEVISPGEGGDGSSSTGGVTQIVVGHGKTIGTALQDIYRASGRTPSLGQTAIMVIGESMFEYDLRDILAVFQLSDAFKDGVVIASCKGEAMELFKSVSPVDSVVTFALQTILINSGENTGTTFNNLARFLERQLHAGYASHITRIEFMPEGAGEESGGGDGSGGGGQEPPKGLFDVTKMDVFKLGRHVATVDADNTKGYVLLEERKAHTIFVVENMRNMFGIYGGLTAEVASKKIETKLELQNNVPVAKMNINLKIKQVYTDSGGAVMNLLPNDYDELPKGVLEDVQKQVKELVENSIKKSVELDTDFFEMYNKFYAAFGRQWEKYFDFNPDYLQKMQFEIEVSVKES